MGRTTHRHAQYSYDKPPFYAVCDHNKGDENYYRAKPAASGARVQSIFTLMHCKGMPARQIIFFIRGVCVLRRIWKEHSAIDIL